MDDVSGFIDPHVHAAPEHIPRLLDDLALVRQARDAGLAGILIKSHTTLTADRATIAALAVGWNRPGGPSIRVWGGLALNRAVGGLNPAAVEAALAYGAAEIWLPTIDAATLSPLDENNRIRPEVHDILELIANHDVILGTGHLHVAETLAVVDAARDAGVRKILITHPEAPFIAMPHDVQRDLAARGCRFERTWVFTTPALGRVITPEQLMAAIRAVGVDGTVLATDMGQVGNPPPVEGLAAYVQACRAAGFTDAEIRHMGTAIGEWLP